MAMGGIGKLRKWVKQINNIGYILQAISFANSVFQKIHRKQIIYVVHTLFFTDS